MAFWDKLAAKLAPQPSAVDDRPTYLIYVMLPEPLQPTDRGSRYEDPLEAELQLADLGFVSGGGSSLSDLLPDGSRQIEYCGIDVDAYDVDAARELLRQHLPDLGCVDGTQLYYRDQSDVPLSDVYGDGLWSLAQPRAELHPGFGH